MHGKRVEYSQYSGSQTASNGLNKKKVGHVKINSVQAKKKLQSNFCNGKDTEICIKAKGHHDDCASDKSPLGPINLEQSRAMEISMEVVEQHNNICIPNRSVFESSDLKYNGTGNRHKEPNLPEFDVLPSEIKEKMWGSISHRSFCDEINKIYDEIVHFRRNIFNLPSGRAGKNFIAELTFWWKQFNSNSLT